MVARKQANVAMIDMCAYAVRKRSMVVWSSALAVAAACIIGMVSPYLAVVVLVGSACGVLNALLTMHGNERLLDHRSISSFVFGSILRIGVFGIVPVEFALHGPGWTMGIYYIGFFTPLGLYAFNCARTLRYGLK